MSWQGVFTLVPDPDGMVLKAPDGRTVFQYMTRKPAKTNLAANSTCCFHPLYTPSGVRLTDLAPGDHHHHRGVFLAWHSMKFREKADFSKFGPSGANPRLEYRSSRLLGLGSIRAHHGTGHQEPRGQTHQSRFQTR